MAYIHTPEIIYNRVDANKEHLGLKTWKNSPRGKILEKTPLKRAGEVQDIAGAVIFLASDMAKFITGIQLYVTGGRHLN